VLAGGFEDRLFRDQRDGGGHQHESRMPTDLLCLREARFRFTILPGGRLLLIFEDSMPDHPCDSATFFGIKIELSPREFGCV